MNNIYCFYIYDDGRLPELIVALDSLRKTNPKYPIACMIGREVSNETIQFMLNDLHIEVLDGTPWNLSEVIYDAQGNFVSDCNCSGKLNLYRFQQYNKIVYLDTDVWVKQNMDELFDLPDGSMARYCWDEQQRTNGGVIVMVPNDNTINDFNNYLEFCKTTVGKFYIPDDQEWMLQKYNDVPRLNYCYNVVASDLFRYYGNCLFDEGAVKLYHFVGTCWNKKLWQANTVHLYQESCHKIMYDYLDMFNNTINEYINRYPHMKSKLTQGVEEYNNLEN